MLHIMVAISLTAIAIGSLTDLKTLEVPDWLNYSLIAVGLGGNLMFSLFHNDPVFIIRSLTGLALSFGLGLLMYYTGQWGGGDSKMIFGLGAMLGVSIPLRWELYVMFLVNILFAGALYGVTWIIVLGVKNRKKVLVELKKNYSTKNYRRLRLIIGLTSVGASILLIFLDIDIRSKLYLYSIIVSGFFLHYLLLAVRVIEKTCMITEVTPDKLTEGDWIMEDIKDGKEVIATRKELGLKRDQLEKIMALWKEGKIVKVKVKYGIPFVPAFFLSMTYTIITGKVILLELISIL